MTSVAVEAEKARLTISHNQHIFPMCTTWLSIRCIRPLFPPLLTPIQHTVFITLLFIPSYKNVLYLRIESPCVVTDGLVLCYVAQASLKLESPFCVLWAGISGICHHREPRHWVLCLWPLPLFPPGLILCCTWIRFFRICWRAGLFENLRAGFHWPCCWTWTWQKRGESKVSLSLLAWKLRRGARNY